MNAVISGADVIDKVLEGERIDKGDALELYRLPIEELGALSRSPAQNRERGCLRWDAGTKSLRISLSATSITRTFVTFTASFARSTARKKMPITMC